MCHEAEPERRNAAKRLCFHRVTPQSRQNPVVHECEGLYRARRSIRNRWRAFRVRQRCLELKRSSTRARRTAKAVTPDFVRAPADFDCHSRRLARLIAERNRRNPVWTWKYRSLSMEWERGLRAPSTVLECLKE